LFNLEKLFSIALFLFSKVFLLAQEIKPAPLYEKKNTKLVEFYLCRRVFPRLELEDWITFVVLNVIC